MYQFTAEKMKILRNYYDQAGGKITWQGVKKLGARKASDVKAYDKSDASEDHGQGTDFTDLRKEWDYGCGRLSDTKKIMGTIPHR